MPCPNPFRCSSGLHTLAVLEHLFRVNREAKKSVQPYKAETSQLHIAMRQYGTPMYKDNKCNHKCEGHSELRVRKPENHKLNLPPPNEVDKISRRILTDASSFPDIGDTLVVTIPNFNLRNQLCHCLAAQHHNQTLSRISFIATFCSFIANKQHTLTQNSSSY